LAIFHFNETYRRSSFLRLDKFLAQSGVGIRKVVRTYIKDGKVSVNGMIITEPAKEIDENADRIVFLGEIILYAPKVYYMFHKPAGCITATKDAVHKTVFDFLHELDQKGIFHVGRLDQDTEGLLLLTNDGEFEHQLMSPKKDIEKTYFFWALGSLGEEDIRKIEQGVLLSKDEPLTKPARVEVQKSGLLHALKCEIPAGSYCALDYNEQLQHVVSGTLTITEGRKHQVKRMLKAVGCYVIYLKRISIGGLTLDETLEKGQYRLLTEAEIRFIFQSHQ
jgi:16S rRNA pseudouridine516 synthase